MRSKTKTRAIFATGLASLLLAAVSGCSNIETDQVAPSPVDVEQMRAEFQSPPNAARPRTWWHWLNGNISQDGIAADLEWMHSVGLGGVQMFDAQLGSAVVVDEPVGYMSDEWKAAFDFAVETASGYGLEYAIAGSPGWSTTGGPWVAPEDGIKKLVWSEVSVAAGERFQGVLPSAPTVTGPYQDIPHSSNLGGAEITGPSFSGDIAVLAFPVTIQDLPEPIISSSTSVLRDPDALIDGDLASIGGLSTPENGAAPELDFTFPEKVTLRSASFYIPNARPPFRDSPIRPRLEAKIDNAWETVTTFSLENVPTTRNFDATTSRHFRIVIANSTKPFELQETAAPGAIQFDFFAREDTGYVDIGEVTLSAETKVSQAEVRAGFAIPYHFDDLPPVAPVEMAGVAKSDVLNLTDQVDQEGRLDWTSPDNRDWRIISYGWSLTGATNHPARPEATGLEVDKYDREAVRRYLDTYLDMHREIVGSERIGVDGISAFLNDSIESGPSNWTPLMIDHFTELRGYDPTPWLLALSGYIVESSSQTDAFLTDWRRTLEELLATQHYETVSAFAKENGLLLYGEALENGRPVLGDDITMRRNADVPMAALWSFHKGSVPRSTLIGDMRGAASVANLYGKDFVAAESMTSSFSPWAFAPADLKRVVDMEFVNGINRIVIHTSPHQPSDTFVPGLSLAIFGQYFSRHESWADMAGPWIDYLSRSSYMLQRGRTVSDIAIFAGEERPVTVLYYDGVPENLPVGYGFDFVNAEVIETDFETADGLLKSPGGAEYRALYILDGATMRLETLQQISQLKADGINVIGQMPIYSPSLNGSKAAFDALASELWSDGGIIGGDVNGALETLGIEQDFSSGDEGIEFLHRQDGPVDIYFVSNQATTPKSIAAEFRATGRTPELWNAVDGTMTPLTFEISNGVTRVPLNLGAEEAVFVVFAEANKTLSARADVVEETLIASIDGPWNVAFQADRGAPQTLLLETLQSLSENEEAGIRYFSGIATYQNTLVLENDPTDHAAMWLDLGMIGDVAEVIVNGEPAGITWLAPYRVNIAPFVKPGENAIEVRVANVWANRLIGDAQPGAEKVARVAAPTYVPNAPLRPSGLIGPVQVIVQ